MIAEPPERIRVDLLPKQLDFVRDMRTRELLYSGAFAAGKTRALCYKLVVRARTPGAREGLCRKTLVALKRTTLRTLLEPEGNLPPVLPRGTYEHNKSDQTIRIYGGGEIVYFGMDHPEVVASMNASGVGIDETIELTEDDYTMLRGRIRLRAPGLANQIYGACNPGPPSHWLAERFGLALGYQTKGGCRAITTRSDENHFLPADYLRDLGTLTGLRHKRFVLGHWCGSDGLCYDQWVRTHHVRGRDMEPVRVVIGVDDGYSNPFCALRIELDGDGRAHVAAEVYESGLQESERVAAVVGLANGADAVVYDSSAASLGGALRAAGLPAVAADKASVSVFDGIGKVQARLADPGDGRPRLTVDPSCVNVCREFETYEWKPGRDEPVKEHDHAMDALRYAVVHIDRGQPSVHVISNGPREAGGVVTDPLDWQFGFEEIDLS